MLLDEPFAGIDPIAVGDIQELVRHLKGRGIGVLITDHNVRETLGLIDRAYIIHAGRVLMEGSADDVVSTRKCGGSISAKISACKQAPKNSASQLAALAPIAVSSARVSVMIVTVKGMSAARSTRLGWSSSGSRTSPVPRFATGAPKSQFSGPSTKMRRSR